MKTQKYIAIFIASFLANYLWDAYLLDVFGLYKGVNNYATFSALLDSLAFLVLYSFYKKSDNNTIKYIFIPLRLIKIGIYIAFIKTSSLFYLTSSILILGGRVAFILLSVVQFGILPNYIYRLIESVIKRRFIIPEGGYNGK